MDTATDSAFVDCGDDGEPEWKKIAGRVLLLSCRTTERQITVIQVPLLDPWIEKQQKRRA